MAIEIHTNRNEVPKNLSIIDLNDLQFAYDENRKPVNDLVRKIIKHIDRSEYISNTTIKTRYGEYLDMQYLSTGCKTAINVLNHPDKCVNCIEAGSDVIISIILISTGNILCEIIPAYTKTFKIDANLHINKSVLHFTDLSELIDKWFSIEG